MIDLTRRELEARLAALDDEHAANRARLAELDRIVPRLEQRYHAAVEAERQYTERLAALNAELARLCHQHRCSVIDNNGQGYVVTVAHGGALPRAVDHRIQEIVHSQRQLDVEREQWLKAGGRGSSGAWYDWDRARIARTVLAAQVAAGR